MDRACRGVWVLPAVHLCRNEPGKSAHHHPLRCSSGFLGAGTLARTRFRNTRKVNPKTFATYNASHAELRNQSCN
jgi:hypothetical protein